MNLGKVISIAIAPERTGALHNVESANAVAGRGLEGDRFYNRLGTYSGKHNESREVTLIETEALEALERDYGHAITAAESRRNIATRGIALNHLVGKQIRIGDAVLRGIRLCEPCGHLEQLAGLPIREGLIHRGGLRAQILRSGIIRVGDAILSEAERDQGTV